MNDVCWLVKRTRCGATFEGSRRLNFDKWKIRDDHPACLSSIGSVFDLISIASGQFSDV
jgi:hypothetical protein